VVVVEIVVAVVGAGFAMGWLLMVGIGLVGIVKVVVFVCW
jgi:hypothetical protein